MFQLGVLLKLSNYTRASTFCAGFKVVGNARGSRLFRVIS